MSSMPFDVRIEGQAGSSSLGDEIGSGSQPALINEVIDFRRQQDPAIYWLANLKWSRRSPSDAMEPGKQDMDLLLQALQESLKPPGPGVKKEFPDVPLMETSVNGLRQMSVRYWESEPATPMIITRYGGDGSPAMKFSLDQDGRQWRADVYMADGISVAWHMEQKRDGSRQVRTYFPPTDKLAVQKEAGQFDYDRAGNRTFCRIHQSNGSYEEFGARGQKMLSWIYQEGRLTITDYAGEKGSERKTRQVMRDGEQVTTTRFWNLPGNMPAYEMQEQGRFVVSEAQFDQQGNLVRRESYPDNKKHADQEARMARVEIPSVGLLNLSDEQKAKQAFVPVRRGDFHIGGLPGERMETTARGRTWLGIVPPKR